MFTKITLDFYLPLWYIYFTTEGFLFQEEIMSQSFDYLLALGGKIDNPSYIVSLYATKEQADNIKATLNTTETVGKNEWTFDDGSIIILHYAGIYSKLPWYFMGYNCKESDAIRYRRANPTPDTSHE
jgi:hypothetical protein